MDKVICEISIVFCLHIMHDMAFKYDKYLNRLQLDIISLLVNFSCEVYIMTRYDFLGLRGVILSNFQTDFIFTSFHINLVHFFHKFAKNNMQIRLHND